MIPNTKNLMAITAPLFIMCLLQPMISSDINLNRRSLYKTTFIALLWGIWSNTSSGIIVNNKVEVNTARMTLLNIVIVFMVMESVAILSSEHTGLGLSGPHEGEGYTYSMIISIFNILTLLALICFMCSYLSEITRLDGEYQLNREAAPPRPIQREPPIERSGNHPLPQSVRVHIIPSPPFPPLPERSANRPPPPYESL